MNVGKYIYSVLAADNGVSAIVGNRIYPVIMAQNATFPAVVYSVTSTPKDTQKTAASDYDRDVVVFNIWADVQQGADGYLQACNLDLAIRVALDFVSGTAGGITVEHCHFDESKDVIAEDRMLVGKETVYTFLTRN